MTVCKLWNKFHQCILELFLNMQTFKVGISWPERQLVFITYLLMVMVRCFYTLLTWLTFSSFIWDTLSVRTCQLTHATLKQCIDRLDVSIFHLYLMWFWHTLKYWKKYFVIMIIYSGNVYCTQYTWNTVCPWNIIMNIYWSWCAPDNYVFCAQ